MKKNRKQKNVFSAVAVAGILSLGVSPGMAAAQSSGSQSGQQNQHAQQQRADALITAESLRDAQVIDHQNREIGSVNNLFIDPESGRIARADIDFNGGLFGAGQRYSVQWDDVNVQRRNGELVLMVDQSIVQRVEQARDRAATTQPPGVGTTQPERAGRESEREHRAGAGGMAREDEADKQRITAAQMGPEQIREVQQQLNKEGFHAGSVDGKWNEDTQTAVRNFQQAKGLEATGQLDEKTLDELGLDADEFREKREQQRNDGGERRQGY